jgi:hypothetical protein
MWQSEQLRSDLGGRPVSPSQTADGIACRIGLQQSLDRGDHCLGLGGLKPSPLGDGFSTRAAG